MPEWDIDSFIRNPNGKIVISCPDNPEGIKTIRAYLYQDISITTENQFDDVFNMSSEASGLINKATTALNMITGSEMSQRVLKTFWTSALVWAGSQKPVFPIEILLITTSTRQKPTITDQYKVLLRGTLPNSESDKGLQVAPYNFTYTSKKGELTPVPDPKTCWGLSIGRWLRIHQLVLRSVSGTISKTRVRGGQPLYIRAQLGFEFYRMPTANEVISWFVK